MNKMKELQREYESERNRYAFYAIANGFLGIFKYEKEESEKELKRIHDEAERLRREHNEGL